MDIKGHFDELKQKFFIFLISRRLYGPFLYHAICCQLEKKIKPTYNSNSNSNSNSNYNYNCN